MCLLVWVFKNDVYLFLNFFECIGGEKQEEEKEA